MTSRRSFLLGIGAALAAPSVVRADSLMKLWVPSKDVIVMQPHLDPVWALEWYEARIKQVHDAFMLGQGFIRITADGVRNIAPEDVYQ
jgi:hypothetical protein